ncbi:hypothetical protein [Paraurantiacibacter namhicola]|uniref:Uncharacterized protein n=1 Tax=Paraurantiacibacter namhicola TaxID=645517 RepID=A0A1C7D7H6_9SPHN|nr:hypothetical protein [Paraurantiacibacter namhicola]ANU07430.1 hypothetical protein A6F65_01122 [Paraurantiacibacter namhicola]
MQGLRALLTRELLAGLVGGLVAAVLVTLVFLFLLGQAGGFPGDSDQEQADITDGFPGRAAMERISCGQGETRLVVMHGMEDNFSPAGEERAVMRPEVARVPIFRSRAGLENRPRQLRDYDQPGADLHLIDSFDLPRGVLSGAVVFAGRDQSKLAWNDQIQIGDLDLAKWPESLRPGIMYYGPGQHDPDDPDSENPISGLRIIRLEEFLVGAGEDAPPDLLRYLNKIDRPDMVDVRIEDDTMIDYLAFVLCLEPEEPRGTTFREHRLKPYGEDYSFFNCSSDMMQPECNADSGDHLCEIPSPVFCYRDGNRVEGAAIERFRSDGNWGADYLVGGEVRVSAPVVPASFGTIDRANAFCAAEFGQGWRVLSFHEAGGFGVLSRSDIAPLTRGLVQAADSPYGNCWDRPESVIGR